jgi:hypothetical protein
MGKLPIQLFFLSFFLIACNSQNNETKHKDPFIEGLTILKSKAIITQSQSNIIIEWHTNLNKISKEKANNYGKYIDSLALVYSNYNFSAPQSEDEFNLIFKIFNKKYSPYLKAESILKNENAINIENDFVSSKYKYKVVFPETFHTTKPKGEHIDFTITNDNLSFIVANVSIISPYDFPVEELYSGAYEFTTKMYDNKVNFIYNSLIDFNGQKAMICLIESQINQQPVKQIELQFYRNGYLYNFMATAPIENFKDLEIQFLTCLNSIRF